MNLRSSAVGVLHGSRHRPSATRSTIAAAGKIPYGNIHDNYLHAFESLGDCRICPNVPGERIEVELPERCLISIQHVPRPQMNGNR